VIRELQPHAVIAIMGPDVRWVGTETGYGRETEWSVVPADNLDQSTISANSQKSINFKPAGDMRGDDLGSRDKIMQAKGLVWYPAEADVSIRPGWFYHPEENNKIKSPEKLLDIYFHSVGRNCVLLMNIPPDKEGLINEADIKNLKEWTKLRDDIFKNNLVKGAVITSSNGINSNGILDGKYETYWTSKGKDTSAVIDLKLKNKTTFNVLMLQENITVGQRIENFELEYWDGKSWKKAAKGTTVGYKRLLQFDPVTSDKVRLKISSSRLNPTIAEMGLYFQQKVVKD
jgi:alpha-L-fucosidase